MGVRGSWQGRGCWVLVGAGRGLALRKEMRTGVALPPGRILSPRPPEEKAGILGLELELGSGNIQGET